MDIREKTGLRIKELRLALNLTQEKLSFKANVDKTYLNEVERGKRNISIINLEKVIVALNSSFPDFFNNQIFNY